MMYDPTEPKKLINVTETNQITLTGQKGPVGIRIRLSNGRVTHTVIRSNQNAGSSLAAEWKELMLKGDVSVLLNLRDLIVEALKEFYAEKNER
jgi:hypothetical protein